MENLSTADALTLRQFFCLLTQGVPDSRYTTIIGFNGKAGAAYIGSFSINHMDELLQFIEANRTRPGTNMYFRPWYLLSAPPAGERGLAEHTEGSNVLYVDLDVGHGVTDEAELQRRIGHGMDALEGFTDGAGKSLAPTVTIFTGRGLQAYWLLSSYCSDIQALRARDKWLYEQFQHFQADTVYDTARVLRVPTTINHNSPGKLIAEVKQLRADRIYDLDCFGYSTPDEFVLPEAITEEALPDTFLEDVRAKDEHLYQRIYSESTARDAQYVALTDNGRRVDRSRNDFMIARFLLSMNYTKGQVMAVLTHPVWFSGSRFRQFRRYDYVMTTIARAYKDVELPPAHYFSGKRFVAERMLDALMQTTHFLVRGKSLWYYQGGVYHEGADRFIEHEVALRLRKGEVWRSAYGVETVKLCERSLFPGPGKEMAEVEKPEQVSVERVWVNTRSGMVNAGTEELRAHSPLDYSCSQLPVRYNPAQTCPKVDQFLDEVLPQDAIFAFWEFIGYCLLETCQFRTALMLVGESKSGKSTVLALAERFFHPSNTTSIPLQDLLESRFDSSSLPEKYANIYADLDAAEVKKSGNFKMFASGDRLKVERKGKDAFFVYLRAKHLFSANQFLPVVDPDEAYANRWIIIRLSHVFEYGIPGLNRANVNLIDELSTPDELSGMLNHALRGLRRLMQNERFTIGPSMASAHDEFQATIDSVFAFLHSETAESEGGRIQKDVLFDRFRSWCLSNGRGGSSMGAGKFYQRVRSLHSRLGLVERRTKENGKDSIVYIGRAFVRTETKKSGVVTLVNTMASH